MATETATDTAREDGSRRHRLRRHHPPKPKRFGDLPDGAWPRIAKRTFDQFRADGVTNLAAALTYRTVLSLFPGLIALIALLGVLGQYPQTYDAILKIVNGFASEQVVNQVSGPLRNIIAHKGGAGALLGVGLAGAIWAASGYIGAFSWAMNVIWEADHGRSWYRQWPFNVAVTIVTLVVLTLVLVGFVLTGPVASAVGDQIGVGSTGIDVWQVAKWPVMVLLVTTMIATMYYITPNVRQPPVRFITPGAILAVAGWIGASLGFVAYVANFNSYSKTYGSLGAVVTFLVWVWITNIAILLGAELDSEIERERELAVGLPAQERIQLPTRT